MGAPRSSSSPWRRILGIQFFTGTAAEAVARALLGGLVVVPSAPVLVTAAEDPATQTALLESDLAITDSGLMVLYWNITKRERLRRVSGLEYLKLLLREPALRETRGTLWVMPNEASARRNEQWLSAQGFQVSTQDFYLAPLYPPGALIDTALLSLIEERKPPNIIIAVGGGVQERLGYYLKVNASYRPAIHCIGAAIGFLNGDQVHIPNWADRFFLGWLFRCVRSPRSFIPRYWRAGRLIVLLWRDGRTKSI